MNAGLFHSAIAPLPPVPSQTVIYKSLQSDTANGATSTFSSVDIGVPHPKRLVVLGCFHAGGAVITATVNGYDPCFKIDSTSVNFSIMAFLVPTNTLATIVVTGDVNSTRKGCAVFVFYPNEPIPLDSGTGNANTTTNAVVSDIKVQAGGTVIYCGGQAATLGAFTTTWGGTDAVVEDTDSQIEAATSFTAGHINVTNSTDISDLTLAETVSGTKRLVAASFGPPIR